MSLFSKTCVAVLLALLTSVSAQAENLADYVFDACEAEIAKYCSQVTPGDNRMLACFYAHEDKLSGKCVGALYDAAETLAAAIDVLHEVAQACGDDIDRFCSNVEMGEGRIANCLLAQRDKLSSGCGELADDFAAAAADSD